VVTPADWCATGDFVFTNIRPKKVGTTLIANGRVVKRGKSIAHMEGEITDSNGLLIATAKGTWAIWKVD
ncbi:MAG: PaaI family thioesterase, partial [Candidatus Thermoplasmatota archaeon]|nr:PaaI family thioesterase [Candidatus Thermoplasmatota archaeon]